MTSAMKRLREEYHRVTVDYQSAAEQYRAEAAANRELKEQVEKLKQVLQSSNVQILHSLESMMVANTKLAEAAAKIIQPRTY